MISFTLGHTVDDNTALKITFPTTPAPFTNFDASCVIISGYSSVYTCSQSGNDCVILNTDAISSGTAL